ncbi:MAG: methyltransferase domain-containing protein, partial [Bacteroidota bacterium]
ILNLFVSTARNFLDLTKNDTLIDLYCGYGLFSLCFAPAVRKVLGIELSRSSIADAIDNIRINNIINAKFISADITVESVRRFIKPEAGNLKLLIDPPRNGTADGVIEFLAQQQPEKVVHIFCNSTIIDREVTRWKNSGYSVVAVQPFDMFPGTNDIEVMMLFKRQT